MKNSVDGVRGVWKPQPQRTQGEETSLTDLSPAELRQFYEARDHHLPVNGKSKAWLIKMLQHA